MAHIHARKHAHPLRRTQTAAAAFAALTLPVAAQAQQAATPAAAASAPARNAVLPEVKVKSAADVPYKADVMSSPKFTQPLVDTPQTITVIKKELLREQGATTLTEALRNTPGITMLAGENGNTSSGDSIFLRGFDTQGSIFVDGIRDLGSISRDVFNIEQVEVVKGPSGSDNGRGASSGYVNLSTKVPFLDSYSTGSVSAGTGSRKRATLDVNRPLDIGVPGTAVRLNVFAQDYGVPGRHEVEKKGYGIAPSIAFGLNSPTRVYLYLLHSEQDNRPDGGVSTIGLGQFYNAVLTPNGIRPPKVSSKNFYGAKSDHEDIDIDMFTARIEHDLAPGITIRNTARYGRSTLKSVLTGVNTIGNVGTVAAPNSDFSTYDVSRSRQGRDQKNEILTNQTNLSAELGSGTFKHSLSTGVEFIYEKQSTPAFGLPTGVTQGTANLYHPSVNDVFVQPVRTGAFSDGDTVSSALYVFDTLKVGEQWQFSGGLRWEHYETDSHSASLSTAAANPTLPVGTLLPLALKTSGNLTSWKLGALYKPAANGSIYVSTANSKQPPGGANFALSSAANNVNNPRLDPQEGRNVEIGTKWEFIGGKLALAGAVFRSENKNELVQDPIDPAVYTQVGKRRVKGVEVSVVGQLTNELHLSAGLAYMEPEIVKGTTAQQGGLIQWSPKVTFTSWATYRLPFGLTLGGGARYVDSAVTSSNVNTAALTGIPKIPSYWVADALVSYEVNKNLSLQLNAYNLFDKDYLASVNSGRSRYFPGVPRSALLTANVTF
ncbi:MAG: catecholate siderophore receptor Fiu [Burkholderiaceae bacterium]|nr:catecholate siderophore receptor Fiu [Burkholderiaceae bacterium]